MSSPLPKTVRVPEAMAPLFLQAEALVSGYFQARQDLPEQGTIEVFGQRYVLVRAASLSVEFFSLVRELYGEGREEEADAFARNLLFDLAHAIGRADARAFHARMGLEDPIAKLSAGPVHFAHTGWAFVDISPDSRPSPDENFYLLYDHPYSFESEAWLQSGQGRESPACIMNAGYSSGWCEASFDVNLVACEVLCRAKGDPCCRFIMSPPARLEGHLAAYREAQPHLAPRMRDTEIPDFFARKRLEEELRRSRDELELRVAERTRQLEEVFEQLRQTQKLEALGRMAGGIAHDFNNLLTAILGYASLAQAHLEEGHPARRPLERLEQAGLRAGQLTRQLLAFSRRQVLQPRVLDLNGLLRRTAALLRPLLGEPVRLDLDLGPGPLKIKADPSQMEQVIVNLAVNARDAMPQGGQLRIASGRAPGGEVRLDVSDSGMGMDQEVLAHLFEPFYTTKAGEKGTGLGLATVYGIVEQSGGRIQVQSEAGAGTRFSILLPATEEALEPERGEPQVAPSSGAGRRVLVVEDEAGVRESLRDILGGHGFQVHTAPDAESALAMEPDLGPLDLLLTDLVMTGMDGKSLAAAMSGRRPRLRILFMSGYTDAPFDDAEARRFLAKPFSASELLVKISEVLRGEREE